MDKLKKMVEILADGKFHSGEDLAKALSVTRASIWKYQKKLFEMGLSIDAVQKRGYRIHGGLSLLAHESIRQHLSEQDSQKISEIIIFQTIDSTNQYALNLASRTKQNGVVCLAEQQTDGRGRRGLPWVSPFGGNVYMSVLWRFERPMSDLSVLSLVIAVKVVEALQAAGLQGIGLKWPNDIFGMGKKLAGILVEMGGDTQGPCYAVIGIGLNVNMPVSGAVAIDQPWIDCQRLKGHPMDRNALSAVLIQGCLAGIDAILQRTHAAVLNQWRQYDILHGKPVTLQRAEGNLYGMASGIDETGRFLLTQGARTQAFHSGEVSISL